MYTSIKTVLFGFSKQVQRSPLSGISDRFQLNHISDVPTTSNSFMRNYRIPNIEDYPV